MVVKVETSLPQIGNAYFMWHSTSGTTHAITPKNKKTYCGLTVLQSWEPTDELPDDKHQPTCSKCKQHYDDPIKESLLSLKKELLEQIEEYLFLRVMLKDADGLGRFVEVVAKFLREEVKRGKQIVRKEK